MKRFWKRTSAMLLCVAMLVAVLVVPASAVAGRSSLYLSRYRAWLTPESGAIIDVTIDVEAVDDMEDVGAASVTMYVSSDGGTTWTRDGTYYSAFHPELLDHDTYLYYDTPISHQGIVGYKYCAVVTVYAGDSTGYDTREYQTTTVTARR